MKKKEIIQIIQSLVHKELLRSMNSPIQSNYI